MTVITRFAPSPTGSLHIGSAKMALFNWLFASKNNGKFMLRIEDTDQNRSTKKSTDAIFHAMQWLGIDFDGEAVIQSKRQKRHQDVANHLLSIDKAYKCYYTAAELELKRKNESNSLIISDWREADKIQPDNIPYTIRLKVNHDISTTIKDKVLGDVTIDNSQIDDMVLLRSDGTPTYLLAVVVDDHDMGVTNIIRGAEHFVNTFRQYQIYDAMGWRMPITAHIPLIHSKDGGKLSKRDGAVGVDYYKEIGILPEALLNYLLRLGWSHGDDEIISMDNAKKWFNLEDIGKSPAKFDEEKLLSLNAHYLKQLSADEILKRININFAEPRIKSIIPELQQRSRTLKEFSDMLMIYTYGKLHYTDYILKEINENHRIILRKFLNYINDIDIWNTESLEAIVNNFTNDNSIKLGDLAKPLRIVLTGSKISPGIFSVLAALGKHNVLLRIMDVLSI